MAITSIADIPGGLSGEVDSDYVRTYTRALQVLSNSKSDGPWAIRVALAAAGFTIGTPYVFGIEWDFGAVCTQIDVSPGDADDGLSWTATLRYGPWPGGNERPNEDPISWLPEVEVSFREFEAPVERDNEGHLITNSAGDPYNPTLARDDSRMILRITRNELAPPYLVMRLIKNTVNRDEWLGLPPRTVKALAPSTTVVWHQNVPGYRYYKVSYQFEIDDTPYFEADGETLIGQGWDAVVLDAGFRSLEVFEDPEEEPVRHVIEVDGQPCQEAMPLDGEGDVLPPEADPHYRAFRIYRELDYGALLGITSI